MPFVSASITRRMVKMADEKLYGIHPVLEALQEERRSISRIFVSRQRRDPSVQRLLGLAAQRSIPVVEVDRAQLQQLSGNGTHQGVVALVKPLPSPSWSEVLASLKTTLGPQTVLCLDNVTDVGNFAALIRSAAAFGVQTILLPRHEAVSVTATVAKRSAGALERMGIVRVGNLVQALEALKQDGFWVYGADTQGTTAVAQMDWPERLVLVLGAEGRGIRRLVRQYCDGFIRIPMHAAMNSLNVATAGAIILAYCWDYRTVSISAQTLHEERVR